MRCLVDSGKSRKHEIRPTRTDSIDDFAGDVPVYVEPAAYAAGEMRSCRSDDKPGSAAKEISSRQPSTDDIERGNARRRELEDRRRLRIEIRIYVPHLESDVAPRISGK